MSRDIAPVYSQLSDKQAAEAFSEQIVRPSSFKVESIHTDAFPQSTVFPPEPSWLTGIVASYLTDDGEIMQRGTLTVPSQSAYTIEDVTKAFVEGYEDHVGAYQITVERTSRSRLSIGRLAVGAVEKARKEQLRTIAAYCLYSAQDSDNHYGAMVIPRATFKELPLEQDEDWRRVVAVFGDASNAQEQGADEVDPYATTRVLSNNPRYTSLLYLVMAQHLPQAGAVRHMFG